jgi:hypothetical protein
MPTMTFYVDACHHAHGRVEFVRLCRVQPDGSFGESQIWFRDQIEYAIPGMQFFTVYQDGGVLRRGAEIKMISSMFGEPYLATAPNEIFKDNLGSLPGEFTLAELAMAAELRPMFESGEWRAIHIGTKKAV